MGWLSCRYSKVFQKSKEMWNMCSAHCEGTCDLPHPRCTRGCMNPGCKCKYGYVRDERTNKCIPLESCPREKQIFDEMDDEDDEYKTVGETDLETNDDEDGDEANVDEDDCKVGAEVEDHIYLH